MIKLSRKFYASLNLHTQWWNENDNIIAIFVKFLHNIDFSDVEQCANNFFCWIEKLMLDAFSFCHLLLLMLLLLLIAHLVLTANWKIKIKIIFFLFFIFFSVGSSFRISCTILWTHFACNEPQNRWEVKRMMYVVVFSFFDLIKEKKNDCVAMVAVIRMNKIRKKKK